MYRRTVLVLASVIVLIDQLTKYFAVRFLENSAQIDLVGQLLGLSFARNPGAAFSVGTGMTFVFTALAVVVSMVVIRTASTLTHKGWAFALGGLLGGALGNLIDRVFRSPGLFQGHVVDFLRFPYDFPLFNIADSAIVCSAVAMVLLSFRGVEMSAK